jgi:hypothetical protein
MSNDIVVINVNVTLAPAPATLQQTGAIVSQGATTLAADSYSLLTQAADLTPLLVAPEAVTSATWASGTLTVTATAALPAHLATGDKFVTTLAGFTPAAVDGQYLATVTGPDTFTIAIATDPGLVTVEGTYTFTDELVSQVNTFFGMGKSISVYVLELGEGTTAQGVTALQAFITGTPGMFYSYLVPRGWDSEPTYLTFLAGFESNTAKTYFFTTTTVATYSQYTKLMKCVVALVEAPLTGTGAKPLSEFTLAAAWWTTLHYKPSGTNRVPKFCFSYLYGVTPYPLVGNAALLAELKAANINYVGTGAEGGISTAIMLWGTTLDGEDFTWWYSADWAQINLDLNISNAIINGSNNTLNPLYYNQQGINVLQDVSVATFNTAITDGLALGPVVRTTLTPTDFTQALDDGSFAGEMVVNAIPFLDYTAENPNDYGTGTYDGLSGVYIPQNGFRQVLFNIDVTNIV